MTLKHISSLIAALMLILVSAQSVQAQSKAELRLYNHLVSSPSVRNCDRFLAKYPGSVLAAEVSARRDTLLNITPYSPSEAESEMSAIMQPGSVYRSLGYRREGVDRILTICLQAPDQERGSIRQVQAVKSKSTWAVSEQFDLPVSFGESDGLFSFCSVPEMISVSGQDYMYFECEGATSDKRRQHLFAAYDPKELSIHVLRFEGRQLPDGRLEGSSDETMAAGMDRPVMQYLLNRIKATSSFVHLDDAVIMTDDAISWWLDRNPDAMTSARSLSFGIIPPESTLASAFDASRSKRRGMRYRAAMFDIRGYTVVVAVNNQTGEYVLVWAEPECRDHSRDRLLNDVYFKDKSNTLVLFYYKGKRTFEYHVNLSDKSIRR